jgi:hypothetical protein
VPSDLLEPAPSCATRSRSGHPARFYAAVGGSSARSATASAASAEKPAQRAVGFARLDNRTKNVSYHRAPSRSERSRLRAILRHQSTLRRLQWCGRRRIRFEDVPIYKNVGVAHFANVQACGSVHACPVCAPKIRQRRASEIDKAVTAHLDAGGFALLQTLTLPHDFGDELEPMLKSIANAFRKVLGGSGYVADKRDYSITGTIRASETTFGKAGAHPHLHVIFFCDRTLSAGDIRMLHARLFARWSSAVESVGYRAPLIGLCPIEPVTTRALGAYVQKFVATAESDRRLGMEMTRHDLKGARRKGRTPFQVLRDFADTGDCADLDLWREWERASHGTQSLTWSKGLKARFNVGDKTDDELAAQEIGGELVTVLTVDQWNLVNGEDGHDEVLEAAETEGAGGVQFWLFCADIRRHKRDLHNSRMLRAA